MKQVRLSRPLPFSSPVVVGGRLFLTGHEGDERVTLCLDAATGKEVWRRAVEKAREETFNRLNGPTTPRRRSPLSSSF